MTLYQPLFLQATTGDTPISYAAQDLRRLTAALAPAQGTVLAGDLAVSQRSAGANMSVDVAAGQAFIAGTSIAGQGTYMVRSDAVTNVTIQAANPSNPRIDLIVARVFDKQVDGGSSYSWTIQAIAGTAASSPVAPSAPASSLVLAQVSVLANATSITTSRITDKRVLSGQGDVPKWDMSNTIPGAQTIPNNTPTVYQPGNFFQKIGVDVDATLAKVTFRTPGRYVCHFNARFTTSASAGARHVSMILYDKDGTTILREIAQEVVSANIAPVCAAGSVYASAGQVLVANFYQNTGQTLSVFDDRLNTNFTGTWIGP